MSLLSSLGFYIFLAMVVVLLGVLTQLEDDSDVLLIEKRVSLPKSRATVFQFLSDMRNIPLWYPGPVSFEPSDSEPMGMGKHFVEVQQMPVIGDVHYDNIITGYESPRFIGFINNAVLQERFELILERQDNQMYPCQLKVKVYSRRRSYLMHYVLAPVLGHVQNDKVRQAMFNLKHHFQR